MDVASGTELAASGTLLGIGLKYLTDIILSNTGKNGKKNRGVCDLHDTMVNQMTMLSESINHVESTIAWFRAEFENRNLLTRIEELHEDIKEIKGKR